MNQATVDSKTPARRRPLRGLIWLVVLLVVYVLSAGPVTWIVYRWGGGFHPASKLRPAIESFYAPVYWVAEVAPGPVQSTWHGYVNFFYELAYRAENAIWPTENWCEFSLSPQTTQSVPAESDQYASNNDSSVDEKLYAGRSLGEWQSRLKQIDPQAANVDQEIPGLLALVQDRDIPWFTRRQAALALGRIQSPARSAVPLLAELLFESSTNPNEAGAKKEGGRETGANEEEEPVTSLWAAKALSFFGPDAIEAVPQLIRKLHHPESRITERLAAVEALAMVGTAHPDVVPTLIDLLSTTGESGINTGHSPVTHMGSDLATATLREAAAEAISLVGPEAAPAIPALIRALNDPAEGVRRKAAGTLGTFGPRGDIALAALLDAMVFDDSADVRDVAQRALGNIGEGAVEYLIPLLNNTNVELRQQTVMALGVVGRDALPAVPGIIPLLHDDDTGVRLEAAIALWNIDPNAQAIAPVLVDLLQVEERQIRLRSSQWILKIGSPEDHFREPLQRLAETGEPEVRRLATETLRKLQSDTFPE